MTDERIEQIQELQSARATCERMGIGYVGMAGKIPWLLDTISALSTERDEALAWAARTDTLATALVEDNARLETSRDALLTAAKALLASVLDSRAWAVRNLKPEYANDRLSATEATVTGLRALIESAVPSELAPSQGGEQ